MRTIQVPRRFVAHPWGGTETVVLETSKRLIARGHPTTIATTVAMSDRSSDEIEGVAIRRYSRFYPYIGLSAEAIKALDQKGGNLFSWSLWRALAREKDLDILHLHTGKRLGGIVRTVARGKGVPYVVSLHGGLLDVPSEEAGTWTQPTAGKWEWGKALGALVGARNVLDDASAIICVSRREADVVQQRYRNKRVVVLPNGVDPSLADGADGHSWRAENGVPQDAPLVTVIGRIDPQKGQIAAVEAVAALQATRPKLHLALIGGVTNDHYFEQINKAASICRENTVHIIDGYARGDRRLWNAYAAADVIAVPSRHEPFGIVALEAWACRRPLVAAKVGGLVEIVDDGENGLLFDSADAASLAAAIDKALSSPSDALAMGQAGQDKVLRQYTWDVVTSQLIRLYEELIDANPVHP